MRCFLRGSGLLGLGEAVAEAPGLVAGVDDVCAVGEPVSDGFGEPGVGEDLSPFAAEMLLRSSGSGPSVR